MELFDGVKKLLGAMPADTVDEINLGEKRAFLAAHINHNRLNYAHAILTRNQNAVLYRDFIAEDKSKIAVLRPPFPADIEYRKRQIASFADKLNAMKPTLPLCFHGTPIYNAEKILTSCELKPSTIGNGLYVTAPESVGFTNYYTNLREFCMPAGVMFAVLPKRNEDYDAIKQNHIMQSIKFRENPEQLFAVITTPENVGAVADIARDTIPNVNVCDYDAFLRGL